jgi:hypothetical protein
MRKLFSFAILVFAIILILLTITQRPSLISLMRNLDKTEVEYEEVKLKDVVIFPSYCLLDQHIEQKFEQVVINSQEKYSSYLGTIYQEQLQIYQKNRQRLTNRPNYTYEEFFKLCNKFPTIDFSRKTLLIQHAGAGGCSAKFDPYVGRDDKNKTFTFAIKRTISGACDMSIFHSSYITIPKIPQDFTVKFEIIDL